jgi:1-deoxy-D-xylulose-5-phosphate reductoisomerase
MKKVVILGASGSIGQQAIEVIRYNQDKYDLVKISVGYNIDELKNLLREFPSISEASLKELVDEFPKVNFYQGKNAPVSLLKHGEYDIVLNAIVGFAGLQPSIKTIEMNKTLALANKETLVVAGRIVVELLKKHPKAQIIPVDSEHCAIFQVFEDKQYRQVQRLIITASGGSLRDKSKHEIENISIKEVLNHPNWNMGKSITVDSATMLNKGLEVIEAHWLFGIDYEHIEVVLHKESIVHSMVEYTDNSILAQMSDPDMKQPIAYALAYPNRVINHVTQPINFARKLAMHFEPIDKGRYPGLDLSYEVARLGGSYPCVLNAAKEVATQAFLDKKIKFSDIVEVVSDMVEAHKKVEDPDLNQLVNIDELTRQYTTILIDEEYKHGNN